MKSEVCIQYWTVPKNDRFWAVKETKLVVFELLHSLAIATKISIFDYVKEESSASRHHFRLERDWKKRCINRTYLPRNPLSVVTLRFQPITSWQRSCRLHLNRSPTRSVNTRKNFSHDNQSQKRRVKRCIEAQMFVHVSDVCVCF